MLKRFLWHGKEIKLTGDNINISSNNFNVDKNGNMSCNNATMNSANIVGGRIVLNSGTYNNFIIGDPENLDADYTRMNGHAIEMHCEHTGASAWIDPRNSEIFITDANYRSAMLPHVISVIEKANSTTKRTRIEPSGITTPKVTQTSMETDKKNFEKISDNAIEIIKATDIYKYNLKFEKDTDKKHIGFIIGDKYNYSKEITAVDENGNEIGVDNYAMTSVCFKAIQEQQEIIETLQEEIKKLKEEK